MNFIEIEDIIINADKIERVERVKAKFKAEYSMTKIIFDDGVFIQYDPSFYFRIREYLKPTTFDNKIDKNVNDFPGDNMVEE